MAGKNIYIERMLDAVQVSMDNVANGMAESVAILEQILANSGLERKNKAFAGAELVALNPTFVPSGNIELGDGCSFNNTTKEINFVAAFGPDLAQSMTVVTTTVGALKRLGGSTLTFKYDIKTTNGYLRDLWQSWKTSTGWDSWGSTMCGYYGNEVGSSGVLDSGSLSASESSQVLTGPLSISTLTYNRPDDAVVYFYFKNSWKTTNAGQNIFISVYDNLGNSVFEMGTLDDTDYIYSVDGVGVLTFDIDMSADAGELSDVKIVANLNEHDSIDLLTAGGDLYIADVGLTFPVAELAALGFALRFNLSTGSTLSGINVRYY